MQKWTTFLIALFVTYLSGCTALGLTEQKKIDIETTNKVNVVSFPTQLRGTFVKKAIVNVAPEGKPAQYETHDVFCAEPPADIGMSSFLKSSLELKNDQTAKATGSRASDQTWSQRSENKLEKKTEVTTTSANGTTTTTTTYNYDTESVSAEDRNAKRESEYLNEMTSNQSLNGNVETSSTVVELAGRTEMLNLARQFLYRNCEGAANGFLTPSQYAAQNKLVIEAIKDMMTVEASKAKAQQAAAEASSAEAKKQLAITLDGTDEELRSLIFSGDNDGLKAYLFEELSQCLVAADEINDEATKKKAKKACQTDYETNLLRLSK